MGDMVFIIPNIIIYNLFSYYIEHLFYWKEVKNVEMQVMFVYFFPLFFSW